MAAQAERPVHPIAHAPSRERVLAALYGCIALVAVGIEVLGLLGDSRLRQVLESWINIHALSGLLLCGLVLARFRWHLERSPRMSAADIRDLSRHLSRFVYLFLYVVIGIREVIGILHNLWHGGPVDFSLFDAQFSRGPDHAGFDPKDDFQLFLTSGLVALLFVRVSAFTLRSRCVARRNLPSTLRS
jgi:cytochrome b561